MECITCHERHAATPSTNPELYTCPRCAGGRLKYVAPRWGGPHLSIGDATCYTAGRIWVTVVGFDAASGLVRVRHTATAAALGLAVESYTEMGRR